MSIEKHPRPPASKPALSPAAKFLLGLGLLAVTTAAVYTWLPRQGAEVFSTGVMVSGTVLVLGLMARILEVETTGRHGLAESRLRRTNISGANRNMPLYGGLRLVSADFTDDPHEVYHLAQSSAWLAFAVTIFVANRQPTLITVKGWYKFEATVAWENITSCAWTAPQDEHAVLVLQFKRKHWWSDSTRFVFPRPRNAPLRNYFRNTGTRLTARPYTKDGNLMKLVIIYGPEASGKLTIARALAQKTGFRLFHNHVSVDVAKVLFDFGEEAFSQLIWDVRLLVFEHAARAKVPGLIFTWAYSHPDFLPYLERIRTVMANYQAEICYVFLSCSVEELKRRVLQPDRNTIGKINSIEALEKQWGKKNYQVIPGTDTLVIDNTLMPPAEVVQQIMTHYQFEISRESSPPSLE